MTKKHVKHVCSHGNFKIKAPRDVTEDGPVSLMPNKSHFIYYVIMCLFVKFVFSDAVILVSFQISEEVIVSVFAHVCHVMTFVPADCVDQLFVLTLDLVTRPTVSNFEIIEQLKSSVNILSSEVHRAALTQKLNQNL